MTASKTIANSKPTFCLSLDFELLLGYHDLSEKIYRSKKSEMREVRKRIYGLIEVLEKYEFKCTWAVVSHLFLEKCHGHRDYPDRKWLRRDPETDVERNPLWYGRDIVERLLRNPYFEIGCHSFSHVLFDDAREKQVRYELLKSEQLAKKLDSKLKLQSFVFPRDRIGHRKLLSKFGYKAYRSRPRKTPSKSLMQLADYVYPTRMRANAYAPKPQRPRVDEYGLVDIPNSMFLSNTGALRFVSDMPPRNYFRWKIRQGIEKLLTGGGVLHFSMHPYDYENNLSKRDFENAIELVQKYRAKGKLHVLTMSEVADLYIPD